MTAVFVQVLACAWGKTSFSFAEDGALVAISIRPRRAPGVVGTRPPGAPSGRALQAWLRDYERGGGKAFPGRWAIPGRSEFRRRVYAAVAAIPVGETRSYGEVAAMAGSPGASRAVGTAMGENPLPLLVP